MKPPANTPLFSRRAGVLAHVSSLPGPAPDGDLGEGTLRFLDWCSAAGLTLWQVLPLGPPGPGRSPYACSSAFAGNPRWYDGPGADFTEFVESPQQAAWLHDWALYAALKEHHDGRAWTTWDTELRHRDPAALRSAARCLAGRVRFHTGVQAVLDARARAVRAAAEERGIVWVGDLPFYVALDSADVWARREYFRVDRDGNPEAVAGVPPDAFSESGQRWNQPLFDWDALARDGYAWWIARCRAALRWVHALRLDHFRGYESFWEIPPQSQTAVDGRWVRGPGAALFESARQARIDNRFVAEDLGDITDDVRELRRRFGFPGMHVLQFGLDDETSTHHPSHHERHAVACTGTHDNDTFAGWFGHLDAAMRERVATRLGSAAAPARSAVELVWASPAVWAIAPLQDFLELGSQARMNFPGRSEFQWGWRCTTAQLTDERAAELACLARRYGRV